ncbi:MAG: hypothetical protein K9N23_00505 [Akkermansiaceae bacterium]|nr:hypothetical protein [Akkermansiaceae bacterium]
MKSLLQLLILTALPGAALVQPAAAQVSAQLTSRHLALGEVGYFDIVPLGKPTRAQLFTRIQLPNVPGVSIKPISERASIRPSVMGRDSDYAFQYEIQSYTLGRHIIPSIEVPWDTGTTLRTEPIEFTVFDPAALQWQEVTIAQQRARCAVGFHLLKEVPYPGEAVPVEIKLYLAAEVAGMIADWGIPEFETDGVACWRIEPSSRKEGMVRILNRSYVAVAYTSTLTPIRSGEIGIGPAKLRLTSNRVFLDPNGGFRHLADEAILDIPKLSFETEPLPPGAPEGFDNAIGSFTLRSSSSQTEVREGDPIAVDVVVAGSGNLDTLRPPRLQDPKNWKIYEANATQRGDERRQLPGSVVFQQHIKPLSSQTSIPPFLLSFFDPTLKQYRTVTTPAIPLQVIPATTASTLAAAPPQALPIPLERMTDILANLQPARLLIEPRFSPPSWTANAAAALLAILLILRACWLRLIPRFARSPRMALETHALAELARTPATDDRHFLKQAGAFIERWLGDRSAPELQTILAERDTHCFRADPAPVTLGKRRHEILKTLRKAIHTVLFLAVLSPALAPSARAQETAASPGDLAATAQAAFESANFEEAIRLWMDAGDYDQLSPDTLYNIGNACYRMGSPGHAALYYRRALVRDPGHAEARQNLRFIERKCGAITIQRPEYQYTLARIPLVGWTGAVWTGAWLVLLGLLAFPATRSGARLRIAATVVIVIGPMLAAAGLLGWHYYPDDAAFAPSSEQAVITAEKLVLHTAASRTSPEVIEAPAGSLCRIVRVAGNWVYIAFATQTRGWVPADAIEPVIPTGLPTPPRNRKPAATERSA